MDFMNFVRNLKWMGIGMLGVFMIIAIIMGATYLINFTVNKIQNRKSENSDEEQQ